MESFFIEIKDVLEKYNKDLDELKTLIQKHEKRIDNMTEKESKSTSGEKK